MIHNNGSQSDVITFGEVLLKELELIQKKASASCH
jgi:hypothetical protein